jgi:hypothetical protein
MDSWLIRSTDNHIRGPFDEAEIRDWIVSGKLKTNDEICLANGYWVYLYEREEIRRLLGITPPSPSPTEEEITITATDPDLPDIPEMSEPGADLEQTLILKNRALRKFNAPAAETPTPTRSAPIVLGGNPVEKPAIYKALAWVLGTSVLVILLWVMRVIRN